MGSLTPATFLLAWMIAGLSVLTTPGNALGDVLMFAKRNNDLACRLYQAVANQHTQGNVAIAPTTLTTMLLMLHNGAQGNTADEIAAVLGVTSRELAAVLPAVRDWRDGIGQSQPAWHLRTQSDVWTQSHFAVNQAFIQRSQRIFDAGVHSVDFMDSARAIDTINAQIARASNGDVGQVLATGDVSPQTRMVVTNWMTFRGNWHHEFTPEATRPLRFQTSSGEWLTVPMMSQKEEFRFVSQEGLAIIELPYRDQRGQMLLIAPETPKELSRLESSLTYDQLEHYRKQLQQQEVLVFLPKFKMTETLLLATPLKRLGLKTAFGSQANFGGIHDRAPLYLAEVHQMVDLEVDEVGSMASASSAAVINKRSLKAVFRADRPFLFFVIEKRSNVILLMGRVGDPREKQGR